MNVNENRSSLKNAKKNLFFFCAFYASFLFSFTSSLSFSFGPSFSQLLFSQVTSVSRKLAEKSPPKFLIDLFLDIYLVT